MQVGSPLPAGRPLRLVAIYLQSHYGTGRYYPPLFFYVYNRLFHLDIKRERFPCRLAGSREPGAGALSIEPVWSAVQRSNGLFPD